ncbi:MAG: glycosyltransferase family 39 protein, partial [Woeseiales bacterium]
MSIQTTIKSVRNDPVSMVIVVVLAISLILRLFGVDYGLPFLFHNDEGNEVLRALQLGTGSFDFERISKGGFFYVLFVEFGFLFVFLKLFGVVGSASDFGAYFIENPTAFYLLGRATTALIGTVTVYIVYRIGKLAYSPMAALAAAILLSVNVLHAQLSHYITVDVPMVCLASGALYFAIKISSDGKGKDYFLAAILAALATTTKISAVLLLLPLFLAHVFQVNRRGGQWHEWFVDKRLLKSAVLFIGAYIIVTPGILVNFGPLTSHILRIFGGSDAGSVAAGANLAVESFASRTNLFGFYFGVIVASMTWPVFVLCAAGTVYAIWRRRQADILLLSFGIAVYLLMSLSADKQLFFPRYILPLFPIMALFGGRLLSDVLQSMQARWRNIATALILAVLCVTPLIEIVQANIIAGKKDTRAIAKEWFDAEIPYGSRVFIEGSRGSLYEGTVPLRNSAKNIESVIEFYRTTNPGKARYFRMALKAATEESYDLYGVRPNELESLDHYKSIGIQYFILRPTFYGNSRLRRHWAELVREIRSDSDMKLLHNFESVPNVTPGPTIEIYQNL